MNGYTNERVKKEAEQESLNYFLEAYENITGETLEVIEVTERPDFICIRNDGSKVGVELVKVRRGHPNDILWDMIIDKQEFMSLDQALEMIQEVAAEKERKRNESDWKHTGATILLIELCDIPLAHINSYISSEILPDLYSIGFEEIWLADFTGIEAYDNVELFCVRPEEWKGYHSRGIQKPYG